MRQHSKPLLIGALMGLMMLGMAHMVLTGQSGLAGWALAGFVGAHLALALLAIVGTTFAARLSPAVRRRLDRLHLPSADHIGKMLLAAGVTAAMIHLFVHGGL